MDNDNKSMSRVTNLHRQVSSQKPKSKHLVTLIFGAIAFGILVVIIAILFWAATSTHAPKTTNVINEPTKTHKSNTSHVQKSNSSSSATSASNKETESSSQTSASSSQASQSSAINNDTDTNNNESQVTNTVGTFTAYIATSTGTQSKGFNDLSSATAWCNEQLNNGTASNYWISSN